MSPERESVCREGAMERTHKYLNHSMKRRMVILEHARSLFIEKGVSAVSMSDVAEQCGMTRTTLYRYYENKDQLLWAVYNLSTEHFFSRLKTEFESFSGTTYDRFVFLRDLLDDGFRSNRDFFLYNDVFNSLYHQATVDAVQGKWPRYRNEGLGSGDTVRFLTVRFHDGSVREDLEPIPTAVAFFYGCIAVYTKFVKVYGILPLKYGVEASDGARFCTEALLSALRPPESSRGSV